MIYPNKFYKINCPKCNGTGEVKIEEHWGGPYPIYHDAACNECENGKIKVTGDHILHSIALCEETIDKKRKEIEVYSNAIETTEQNYG